MSSNTSEWEGGKKHQKTSPKLPGCIGKNGISCLTHYCNLFSMLAGCILHVGLAWCKWHVCYSHISCSCVSKQHLLWALSLLALPSVGKTHSMNQSLFKLDSKVFMYWHDWPKCDLFSSTRMSNNNVRPLPVEFCMISWTSICYHTYGGLGILRIFLEGLVSWQL